MNINKLKRAGIITGSVAVFLYVVFLILPLILTPVLNSYSVQIAAMIEEASGYKVKLEKLGVVTTPKLTAGIKVGHAEFMLPTGEEFMEADDFRAKLSLLPLLIGRIEADSVSIESISANLQVRQDGKFLLEEFLPQPDPDMPAETTLQPLPFGFKLSNRLPDIRVNDYIITFVDMATKSEYTLSGQDLKLKDFILDKRFKFSTAGNLTLNSVEQFSYNVKLFNRLMPEISLNDLVFNPQPQQKASEEQFVFNIIDLFKALNKSELSANLDMDLKTSGSFSSPELEGFVNLDKISVLVDGKKLPDSFLTLNAKGSNIKLDMNLFSGTDEKTILTGNFKTGRHPKVDMQFK